MEHLKEIYDAEGVVVDAAKRHGKLWREFGPFLKRVGLTIQNFFVSATKSFTSNMDDFGFKVMTFISVRHIKSNTGIKGNIYESEVVKEILASKGNFTKYKHFDDLSILIDYLKGVNRNTLELKFNKGRLKRLFNVLDNVIYTYDALKLNRNVHAANVLYTTKMSGKVSAEAYVAWNPYIMIVIALITSVSMLVRVLNLALLVEKGSRIKNIDTVIGNIADDASIGVFNANLRWFKDAVESGEYPKYIQKTVDMLDGQSYEGAFTKEKYEEESAVFMIAFPVVFYMVSSLVLIMIQFSVYYVYHLRGRIAITYGELIASIEEDDSMDSKKKQKKIDRLYKAMVRIDIEEHESIVKKSKASVKNNVESVNIKAEKRKNNDEDDDDGMEMM